MPTRADDGGAASVLSSGGSLRPRLQQSRDRVAHHEAKHENPLHRQGRMKS